MRRVPHHDRSGVRKPAQKRSGGNQVKVGLLDFRSGRSKCVVF